jgi:hypothetical protein
MKISDYNKAVKANKENLINEETATDAELYQHLDGVRYINVMRGRYDGTPMPRDYPRKIVRAQPKKIEVPTRKVTAPAPTNNKKIFHGKPVAIDVKDLSKGIINPAPVVAKAPDLRKKVDPDLLKGVGYLLGSIPDDFKN